MNNQTSKKLRALQQADARARLGVVRSRHALVIYVRELVERGVRQTEIAEVLGMTKVSVNQMLGKGA